MQVKGGNQAISKLSTPGQGDPLIEEATLSHPEPEYLDADGEEKCVSQMKTAEAKKMIIAESPNTKSPHVLVTSPLVERDSTPVVFILTDDNSKECIQCDTRKKLEDFSPNKTGNHGRLGRCKVCRNKNNRDANRDAKKNRSSVIQAKVVENPKIKSPQIPTTSPPGKLEPTPAVFILTNDNSKECKHCDIRKKLEDFTPDKRRSDGTGGTCKICRNKHLRDVYKNLSPIVVVKVAEKECTKCHKTRPAKDFNASRVSTSGLQPWCCDCRATAERARMSFSREHREGQQCVRCGYNEHWEALDMAHFSRNDKFISPKTGLKVHFSALSLTNMKKEAAKVRPLCKNCHRLETAEESKKEMQKSDPDKQPENILALNRAAKKRSYKKCAYINAEKLRRDHCLECKKPVTQQTAICFDFDHRNPQEKIKDVSSLADSSLTKIDAEMAKCDLLCAICHFLKSLRSNQLGRRSKKRKLTRIDIPAEMTETHSKRGRFITLDADITHGMNAAPAATAVLSNTFGSTEDVDYSEMPGPNEKDIII
jgi:hypothetical protein